MISFHVPTIPVAQPRQRHRVITMAGKAIATNYTPAKHPVNTFKAAVQAAFAAVYSGAPLEGPLELDIEFVMPRPRSMLWKAKAMSRVPDVRKPDIDNLVKSVLDALCGLAFANDSMIYSLHSRKFVAAGNEQPHVTIGVGYENTQETIAEDVSQGSST